MKTRLTVLLLSLFSILPISAQYGNESFDEYRKRKQAEMEQFRARKTQEMNDFRERKLREFNEYRKRKSKEFADFLNSQWAEREQMKPIPKPTKPDPVNPPVAPKEEVKPLPDNPVAIPTPDVRPPVTPKPSKPEPIPLPEPEPRPANTMQVKLFGMTLNVAMTDDMHFSMKSIKPEAFKKAIQILDDDKYTPLIEDFARYSDDMHLNGWARMCLSKAIADRLLGEGSNEAVVLQTYLMAMMGYDIKPVSINNHHLAMMFASNMQLCGIPYIVDGEKRYYISEDLPNGTTITTPDSRFKGGTCAIDFAHATQMQLDNSRTQPKEFRSKKDSEVCVEVSVNRSLMLYYEGLPAFQDLAFYAREPMETILAQQILPTLRGAISGMSEQEAANLLIHFVQTAFDYKNDDEQFGFEKPFFKEELFYHRYSDCEDRAILYAGLVQTLLGLDVVLIHYPGHMCTAVKFKENIMGDYTMIDGQKYIICDPCYIAVNIGRCMPQYQNEKPEALRIR